MSTLTQILALVPDNTTGEVSAADLREAITALWHRTDGTDPIEGLLFNTATPVIAGEGHVAWNSSVGTLDLKTSTDATLQVGHEAYINARNTTGATILNGRPVRITGGQGSDVLVSLANGLGTIVGVATEDIPNNSTGRVTTFGVVNDIDTQAFSDGNVLYASATGTLTTSLTSSFVGFVLNASPTAGRIMVLPATIHHSSGTTAQRPTTVAASFMYFDTTLGIPVFWSGSAWKNASGATV